MHCTVWEGKKVAGNCGLFEKTRAKGQRRFCVHAFNCGVRKKTGHSHFVVLMHSVCPRAARESDCLLRKQRRSDFLIFCYVRR